MNRTAVNEALGVSFLDLLKLAKHSYEKGKESIEGNKNTSSYSYNSAAESSSKLIAVFPILASRSVSSDTANKIAKYIEVETNSKITRMEMTYLAIHIKRVTMAEE